MQKSEWSLLAFTEKDISRTIVAIAERPHTEEDFTFLLTLKESHQKENATRSEELLKALNCKIRRREEEESSLCSCCLEAMTSSKYWCKICGTSTCKKCLVRQRELRDQAKALFCDKCDQEYLKAMGGIQQLNKTEKLGRSLSRLIREQENLEELVVEQRKRQSDKGEDSSQLISQGKNVQRLLEENKILKVRCAQLSKKVEFGKSISRDLRRKLKGLRKEQGESFGTVSNNGEEDLLEEKDQLNLSVDHRQSILTTATDRIQDIQFQRKCKCDLY